MITQEPDLIRHRDVRVPMFKVNDKTAWMIRGIRVLLIKKRTRFWLIASNVKNEAVFPDDGPYPSAEVAAMSATLQESL